MNQSFPPPDSEPSTEIPATKAFPGRLLRNLRESRNLSIGDVAQALKFSPRQIEALERDDFAALPGTTFVRGFIRSYAKWLKTDSAPLLLMLDEERAMPAQEILAPEHMGAAMPKPRGANSRVPVLVGLLVVTALAAIAANYLMFGKWPVLSLPPVNLKQPEPLASSAPLVSQPVQELPTPTVVSTETALSTVAPPAPGASPPVATSAAAAELTTPAAAVVAPIVPTAAPVKSNVSASLPPPLVPPAAAETPPSPAKRSAHQLVFTFEGKSWVEVKDASGRIVFAQINPPGSRQVVGGKPPFQVVVGNAAQVKLQMDERAVDLVPYIRAEVARLTVE